MATFTAGAIDWKVHLTVGMLAKIRRECGLNLANAVLEPEQFLEIIGAEPEKLVAAFWIVCEPQATQLGKTPEEFGGLFDGEALDQAVKALLDGSIDFFPKAHGREAIRKGMPRTWAKIEKDVNEKIEKQLDSMYSTTAGNSPESSE